MVKDSEFIVENGKQDKGNDDGISELTTKIMKLEQENMELISENNDLLIRNNELIRENNRLISYNHEYIKTRYELLDKINSLTRFKEDVLGSNSWKLTKFLRMMKK